MVMTSRGEHYSARDQVPRAGTFDPATLILKANEKRINQKELVDLIIRTGSRVEQENNFIFKKEYNRKNVIIKKSKIH
jgi:hypothetical protein